MQNFPTREEFVSMLRDAWVWVQDVVLSPETLLQFVILLGIILISEFLARFLKNALIKLAEQFHILLRILPFTKPLYRPFLIVILANIASVVAGAAGHPDYLFAVVTSLTTAWIVIRLAVNVIRNRSVARFVAISVWSLAALNIVGWLDTIILAMQNAAFQLGETRITVYGVLWGIASFAILIWLALFATRLVEGRLANMQGVNPSARVLISKTARIVLVTIAFFIALNSTGIDLTAFAVFGGALGVGIGFGLQKVVSNFISGVILLLDRSIKPGDVIETQGTYGSINSLAARYTSVITRDGTEYLIPNEDMITQPVINWSHSNSNVRRKIPVNVAYSTDLKKAMDIMNECASEHPRTISVPSPRTLLKGFGDNGVDLELRMWIADPQNGVSNVASDVLLRIWDRFHEEGIEFPFPQRVVHMAPEMEEQISKLSEKKKA